MELYASTSVYYITYIHRIVVIYIIQFSLTNICMYFTQLWGYFAADKKRWLCHDKFLAETQIFQVLKQAIFKYMLNF